MQKMEFVSRVIQDNTSTIQFLSLVPTWNVKCAVWDEAIYKHNCI